MYDSAILCLQRKLYDKPPDQGGAGQCHDRCLDDYASRSDHNMRRFCRASADRHLHVYYVTTTQAGRYTGRWLFTMGTGKTTTYPEMFDVRPPDPGLIMSLTDAKSHLNITSTVDDDELRAHLESITRVIEDKVGAVIVKRLWKRSRPARICG
jgi:hypothetical protein